jgi:hypothetical protein
MEDEMAEKYEKMNQMIQEKPQIQFSSLEREADEMCIGMDESPCCHPRNLKVIADGFMYFFKNSQISRMIKITGFYPFYAIMTQGFYESALEYYKELNDIFQSPKEEQIRYLHRFSMQKDKRWTPKVNELYSRFRSDKTEQKEMFEYIMEKLGIRNEQNEMDMIRGKIIQVDEIMTQFAKEDKSVYDPNGQRLFKEIFKIITVDSFCNFSQTNKDMGSIIYELESVQGVAELLKVGTICGLNVSIVYFITFIVLVLFGLFGFY